MKTRESSSTRMACTHGEKDQLVAMLPVGWEGYEVHEKQYT